MTECTSAKIESEKIIINCSNVDVGEAVGKSLPLCSELN